MWILELIPESLLHLLLLISIGGVVSGFVLGFLPVIGAYKLPIQIVSVLLLTVSVYLEGGLSEKREWDTKVKILEARIAQAEADSAKVNSQIVTKIITKREIVRQKGDTIIKYIEDKVTPYDKTCPVPSVVITAHNAAALNQALDEVIETKIINEAAKTPIKLPKK